MQVISPDQTTGVELGHAGGRYVMTDYLGSYDRSSEGPQGYLVRQEAPELRAHFHEVDQFQVVVAGAGTIGRDPVRAGSLHYTDGFTSYGPLRTDREVGLTYFTLRRSATTGINFMPEERARRAAAAGHGEHFTCQVPDAPPPRDDWGAEPHELARTARGAAAYAYRLPAGATPRVLPAGREAFAVVLDGVVHAAERSLPAGSLIHADDAAELGGIVAPVPAVLAVLAFAGPQE